ncbi:hypothetical protein GCM10025789_15870 [Tessaracoccus lubricantis]|uniref:Uncharacterized protein n=1 Tax=Tessaracoccus lubricantis TaxID=545543 RepID=A0ABP9FBT2_9ACTN
MSPIQQTVEYIIDTLTPTRRHDERGLSQSTENAILLAGAAGIAVIIITVITAYVTDNLPG